MTDEPIEEVEAMRPPEFENDHDWAQASFWDKCDAEEKLGAAMFVIEEAERLIREFREYMAEQFPEVESS